jgi:hypothetical protein
MALEKDASGSRARAHPTVTRKKIEHGARSIVLQVHENVVIREKPPHENTACKDEQH